jgi:hypothetical protein
VANFAAPILFTQTDPLYPMDVQSQSALANEVTNGGQEKKPDTGSHQAAKQMVFAGRKIDDRAMRIEWNNPSRFRQGGRWPVSVVILPDKKRREPENYT